MMDPDFKAFIVAAVVLPLAFALIEMVERLGFLTLTKYGALQLITFLAGFSFVAAREYFKKEK